MAAKAKTLKITDNLADWLYEDVLRGVAKAEETAWLKITGELAREYGRELENRIITAENDYTTAMVEGAFLMGIEFGRDPARFFRHTEQSA